MHASGSAQEVRRGGLTWAQQLWTRWVPADEAASYEDNLSIVLPVRAVPVAVAEAAVRDVLARHEGLRTLIDRAPTPYGHVQRVFAVDDLRGVVLVSDEDAGGAVFTAAAGTSFVIGEDWPARFVLFRHGGTVSEIGLVVDHSATDAWGFQVLQRDVVLAVAGRAGGLADPFVDAPPVEQPVDTAAAQDTPDGVAENRRGLQLWRRQAHRLRTALGGWTWDDGAAARFGQRNETGAKHHVAFLGTAELSDALATLTERDRIPPSAILLTAYAAAICAVEDLPAVGVYAVSVNRLSLPVKSSVRFSAMPAPVVVPRRPAGPTRADVLDVAAQIFQNHRASNVDSAVAARDCEDILGDRYGTAAAFPMFSYVTDPVLGTVANARSFSRERLAYQAPEQQGVVTFAEPRLRGPRHMLAVQHSGGSALLMLRWNEHTGWNGFAEPMLWHVHDLVRWAAEGFRDAPPAFGRAR
ncbi:hypothetical protein Daura_23745 [Dactylosporangium aurantiacum]|uniref:Condensation domain-containing protein n=1 Tax=Dactylosporangium aurantiacum TaxID=35754 RepID=A0A9Q9MJD6_9ACTN|nr:hypothetical protein [Dactylosporangium aurantiacum]MDG6103896.1 hypothetical protein [Dactylosporangium aurantiacum]UWZ58914.1 hypothetical protein Daura_23745 [Dactylosporangium aurantiacum]